MKAISVELKCKGDEGHRSHTSPVMLIVLAHEMIDALKLMSLNQTLEDIEGKGTLTIAEMTREQIENLSHAMRKAFECLGSKEEDPFKDLKELDPGVDFVM